MKNKMGKRLAALAISGVAVFGFEGTALAAHSHNLDTPGTTVVDVARGQTRKSSGPACHKFHENVHLGAADSGGYLGNGHSPVRVYKTETAGCTS